MSRKTKDDDREMVSEEERKIVSAASAEDSLREARDPAQVLALKYYRGVVGLSQTALARRLDIAKTSYSNWESGAYHIHGDALRALCELLAITRSRFWAKAEQLYDVYLADRERLARDAVEAVGAFERRLAAADRGQRRAILTRAAELLAAEEEPRRGAK